MKKPKLIFKINRNNTAKIYVGGKWQKFVTRAEIVAEPFDYNVKIEQVKLGQDGQPVIENNEVGHAEKNFHFGAVE